MNGDFTIYCLIDPRNGGVFYVGATMNSLDIRLSAHCVMSLSRVGKVRMAREELITDLKTIGLKPEIMPIKKCSAKHIDKHEKQVYEYFKSVGFNLLQDETKFRYSIQQKRRIHKSSHNYKLLNPKTKK